MLASVISSAGTPRRGTPGTYPAPIVTPSGIRGSRSWIVVFVPMTLTSSENRSSSVICASVSHARSIRRKRYKPGTSWKLTDNVETFAAHAWDLLARDPAEQTVALTVIEAVRGGHRFSGEP